MKLKWTTQAIRKFNQAQEYIEEDNPIAAQQVAQRVHNAVQGLLDNPYMGRKGRIVGTHEWPVTKTSYLLAYRVNKATDTLEILRVIHSKQQWPKSLK